MYLYTTACLPKAVNFASKRFEALGTNKAQKKGFIIA